MKNLSYAFLNFHYETNHERQHDTNARDPKSQ